MVSFSLANYGIAPKIHISHFGDFDPSGEDMDKHIEEQLKYLIEYELPNLKGRVLF
jgi:hypothetical protein